MILVHSHDHGAALQQASRSQENFLNYSAIPWSSELTGRREPGDRPRPSPAAAAAGPRVVQQRRTRRRRTVIAVTAMCAPWCPLTVLLPLP